MEPRQEDQARLEESPVSSLYKAVEPDGRGKVFTNPRADADDALTGAGAEPAAASDIPARRPDQSVAITSRASEQTFFPRHELGQPALSEDASLRVRRADIPLGHDQSSFRSDQWGRPGSPVAIALASSMIVAGARATTALPEFRASSIALTTGLKRLPRTALKHAMGVMLTGRRVDAGEGELPGSFNEVVDGDVLGAPKRLARDILACGPMFLRAAKQAVPRLLGSWRETALDAGWEGAVTKAMLRWSDTVRKPAAIASGRTPHWTGC